MYGTHVPKYLLTMKLQFVKEAVLKSLVYCDDLSFVAQVRKAPKDIVIFVGVEQ